LSLKEEGRRPHSLQGRREALIEISRFNEVRGEPVVY